MKWKNCCERRAAEGRGRAESGSVFGMRQTVPVPRRRGLGTGFAEETWIADDLFMVMETSETVSIRFCYGVRIVHLADTGGDGSLAGRKALRTVAKKLSLLMRSWSMAPTRGGRFISLTVFLTTCQSVSAKHSCIGLLRKTIFR